MRELENAIERAVVLADEPMLHAEPLPDAARARRRRRAAAGRRRRPASRSPAARWREIEREAILRTLEAVGGSTSRAAAMLQISARKIQYKLKEYHQQGSLVERP